LFSPEQWAEDALKKIVAIADQAAGIKHHTADGEYRWSEEKMDRWNEESRIKWNLW